MYPKELRFDNRTISKLKFDRVALINTIKDGKDADKRNWAERQLARLRAELDARGVKL